MIATIIATGIAGGSLIFGGIRATASVPKIIELYEKTSFYKKKAAKKKALKILQDQLGKHEPDQIYFSATLKCLDNPDLVIEALRKNRMVQDKKTGNLLWVMRKVNNLNEDVDIRIPVTSDYEKLSLLFKISQPNNRCVIINKLNNWKTIK